MSIVKLSKVFRKDVETRFGIKPKVSILTEQHGEKWLSTFKVKGTESWEEGMEVQVNVQESGDFLNFTPVGVAGGATAPSSDLVKRVEALEAKVFGGAIAPKPAEPPMQEDDSSLESEF